jgi:hypothetical protein
MSTIKWTALTLAAIVAAAGSVRAEGVIEERKENQQERVGQGVESGQLTAGEAARLEHREAALNHEEHAMRQVDGGKLTPQDRRTIDAQQDRLSKGIYNQKHDAQAQTAPKTEIGQRKENQQDRIGQGIKSGQLTPGEAARLEGKEAKLNQETHQMREENGGKLTPQEHRQVNRQQNHLSRNIYRDKHNRKH